MVKVGERIRQLRRGRGMSQGELVRRTGLQASYVSKVENGLVTPGLVNLERFARALGVTVGELVADSPRSPQRSRARGKG